MSFLMSSGITINGEDKMKEKLFWTIRKGKPQNKILEVCFLRTERSWSRKHEKGVLSDEAESYIWTKSHMTL